MNLDDRMPASVLTIGQLKALMIETVALAQITASRKAAASIERLSATQAAKMIRRRPALIIAACASGSLPATRTGKSWAISARDLDAWTAAGAKP